MLVALEHIWMWARDGKGRARELFTSAHKKDKRWKEEESPYCHTDTNREDGVNSPFAGNSTFRNSGFFWRHGLQENVFINSPQLWNKLFSFGWTLQTWSEPRDCSLHRCNGNMKYACLKLTWRQPNDYRLRYGNLCKFGSGRAHFNLAFRLCACLF